MNALPQATMFPPQSTQEIVEIINANSNRDEKITQQILEKLFNDQNPANTNPLTQEQKKTIENYFGGKLVCVIRHGQTEYNKKNPHVCGSRTNVDLNAEGELEAKACAPTLKKVISEGDTCYSAPLLRTENTLRIFLETIGKKDSVKLQTEPNLIEIDWGAIDGHPLPQDPKKWDEEVYNKYGELIFGQDMPIPGAERFDKAGERLLQGIAKIAKITDQSIIVAVSSGRVMRCANLVLKVNPVPIMGNCDKCIYVVDEKGDVHFLKAFIK